MESANKKKLAASAVLIVASIALLLGLTFAWFTDSVTNKGNRIQAGTLGITATKADVGTGIGPFVVPGLNADDSVEFSSSSVNIEGGAPIISEDMWEPGKSSAKLLTVTNSGNLAAKVKLQFDVLDGGLQDALWFDFVQVTDDGSVTGQFEQRPMSMLSALAEQQEFHLAGGESISFILAYGMSETVGNEFQNKAFEATVSILATQDAVEEDGFGNTDYDKGAEYPTVVSSADELVAMAATGGNIELGADVALAESTTFAADTTLNLNGNTLTVRNGTESIKAAAGTTLAIEGEGTLEGVVYADNNGNVTVNAGPSFAVNSSKDWAVYGGSGSNVSINGGSYSSVQKGVGVIHSVGASLSIKDATVTVGAPSVMNSSGVSSNAPTTYLENVTIDANYSIAVDLRNSYGAAVIKGGSFSTDKNADGFISPTIRYQGTLDISDAQITRVSTGILFSRSWPLPTAVEGLTRSNLTFHPVSGATGFDIDYKH